MGITNRLEGCGWPVLGAGIHLHVYHTHVVGEDGEVLVPSYDEKEDETPYLPPSLSSLTHSLPPYPPSLTLSLSPSLLSLPPSLPLSLPPSGKDYPIQASTRDEMVVWVKAIEDAKVTTYTCTCIIMCHEYGAQKVFTVWSPGLVRSFTRLPYFLE